MKNIGGHNLLIAFFVVGLERNRVIISNHHYLDIYQ